MAFYYLITYIVFTFAMAVILGSVFAFASADRISQRAALVSAAAGISIAYIFVDLLPELAESQSAFLAAHPSRHLLFPEARVYIAALIGYLLFFGIRLKLNTGGDSPHSLLYRLDIIGYSAYVFVITYLMVHRPGGRIIPLLLYTTAMTFHFLVINYAMEREYLRRYRSRGRWILSIMVLLGWLVGVSARVSPSVLTTMLGLVAGGVIINSAGSEMPRDPNAFRYMALGSVIYAVILLISTRLDTF